MDTHPMEMDPRRKVADDIKEIFESAINDESEMWNVVRLFYDSPESRGGLTSDEVLLYHRVKIYLAIKSIYSIDVDTDQRKSWFRRKER